MSTLEQRIAYAMMGQSRASVLMTDAYKASMAQAGAPLRRERFVLAFRKPGFYYIPFDLAAVLQELLPNGRDVTVAEDQFLRGYESNGYDLSPAMVKALDSKVDITCPPKGSWVCGKEPLAVLDGPSFKVSWPEPMAIWLHFPIQVATAAMKGERRFKATCASEATIINLTLEAMGIQDAIVTAHPSEYRESCLRRVQQLANAVGLHTGRASHLFEVGMRAATCMEMHEIALQACKMYSIHATSNMFLAYKLGMHPIGTTGHEHQQRWAVIGGPSPLPDQAGYRAIRDMRPRSPSYLPDTIDADNKGLPAAVEIIRETPGRECFVRFDEREKIPNQLAWLHPQVGSLPVDYVFEDGIRPESALKIRRVCDTLGVEPWRQHYGSGGFLVVWEECPYQRDVVQAIFKLCETGNVPVMKHSSPEKQSIPGNPVIFRRLKGYNVGSLFTDAFGIIAQKGESEPPKGFRLLDPNDPEQMTPEDAVACGLGPVIIPSPATNTLIHECRVRAGFSTNSAPTPQAVA